MDKEKGEYDFYLRYNISHKGNYGFEFLEFEFMPNGRLRYGNNSNYKGDGLIRKEVYVTPIVLEELKKIIRESKILNQDDSNWPKPEANRRQELEIIQDNTFLLLPVKLLLLWKLRKVMILEDWKYFIILYKI